MTTKPTYTPAIRFPDFLNDGEWEVKRLGEIAELYAGATPSTTKSEYWKGGTIPWMSSGEVHNGQIFQTEKKITTLGYDNCSTKLVPPNSVVVALAGQGKTRGTVAITRIQLCTNQSLCSIIPNSNYCSDYLYFYLGSQYEVLRQISSGDGTRGGLNLQMLKDFLIPFPPLAEQRRIAACLSALDEMLAATNGKLEQLKAYKKGLMQKLFPAKGKKLPKLRFKEFEKDGEWEEKKLATIVHQITTGKLDANAMVSNGEYRFYTCAKDYAFINEYAFDTEALLISGNGAHLGYIHYYKGKFNAYQRTYVLSDFQCDIFYLKYYLESFLPDRINKEKKEGNTPYIVLSTLTEMDISLPSNFEQHKIADCLTSIDEMINQYTNKVTFLGQYKKGLMQRMFPQ